MWVGMLNSTASVSIPNLLEDKIGVVRVFCLKTVR